jgi:hypothetical protein
MGSSVFDAVWSTANQHPVLSLILSPNYRDIYLAYLVKISIAEKIYVDFVTICSTYYFALS